MNILLVSFGNLKYDGRLRELLSVCRSLGETKLICSTDEPEPGRTPGVISYRGAYTGFPSFCIKMARQIGRADILFLDNRKSLFPGMLIRKLIKPAMIIYDMRELYILRETRHLAGKIGCLMESLFLRKADLVISANAVRAGVTKDIFHLKEVPAVFENYRRLSYDKDYDVSPLREKYAELLGEAKMKMISTAGCSLGRGTKELVEAAAKFQDRIQLVLVGEDSGEGFEYIQRYIQQQNIRNVTIFGRVDSNELKFLVDYCDAGVVMYRQHDLNNKYCASGKIFEFIYCGKPVIATDNPPLADFCQRTAAGYASASFEESLAEMLKNYESYRAAALAFADNDGVAVSNRALADTIKRRYARAIGE